MDVFLFWYEEISEDLELVNHEKERDCVCLLIWGLEFVKDGWVEYWYLVGK